MNTLTANALQQLMIELPGWQLDDGKLFREYQFMDFREAFDFMEKVARLADRHNHHPDWWNSYRTVRIWLTSHDSGGLTERDEQLAKAIQALDHTT
ncbi:MAG TPA: 4a-hydroxytetrahydrobiopterin dehydratase [Pseudomonadales bacterium]